MRKRDKKATGRMVKVSIVVPYSEEANAAARAAGAHVVELPDGITEAEKAARAAGVHLAFEGREVVLPLASPSEKVLAWAKVGDWSVLADYIEGGHRIDKEIRKFLVSILRQETPKPNNRAPKFETYLRGIEKARFVLSLEEKGIKRNRAIDKAAEKFGVDRRTIERSLEGEVGVKMLMLRELAFRTRKKGACRIFNGAGRALHVVTLSQHLMS
jgi:hypothetical protein